MEGRAEFPELARESGFRGLVVWQMAMGIAADACLYCQGLPQIEQFALGQQIRRCAGSIPANIAEGYGRDSSKSYIQFLRVAKGSLNELETHLLLAERIGYAPMAPEFYKRIGALGTKLTNLMRRIQDSAVCEPVAGYDANAAGGDLD
ncbi:MAG: hypothetical protein AMXMBFR81_09830 [Chthonomonas sp.]